MNPLRHKKIDISVGTFRSQIRHHIFSRISNYDRSRVIVEAIGDADYSLVGLDSARAGALY